MIIKQEIHEKSLNAESVLKVRFSKDFMRLCLARWSILARREKVREVQNTK